MSYARTISPVTVQFLLRNPCNQPILIFYIFVLLFTRCIWFTQNGYRRVKILLGNYDYLKIDRLSTMYWIIKITNTRVTYNRFGNTFSSGHARIISSTFSLYLWYIVKVVSLWQIDNIWWYFRGSLIVKIRFRVVPVNITAVYFTTVTIAAPHRRVILGFNVTKRVNYRLYTIFVWPNSSSSLNYYITDWPD